MNKLLLAFLYITQTLSFLIFARSDAKARRDRKDLRDRNLQIYLKGAGNA
jgi:hypothetical protein